MMTMTVFLIALLLGGAGAALLLTTDVTALDGVRSVSRFVLLCFALF